MRESLESVRPHAGITVIAGLLLGVALAAVFLFFVAARQASFGSDEFEVQLTAVFLASVVVPIALLTSLLAVWIAGGAVRDGPPVRFGLVYGAIATAATVIGALVLGAGVLTIAVAASVLVVSVLGGWMTRKAALAVGRL